MNPDLKNKLIAVFIILILLMSIILISLSIKVVETNEYGVVYDSVWKTFDKRILIQGRYALQPTSTVIKFKSVYLPIDFTSQDTDLDCISNDGLVITIDAVSQYKYLQDKLIATLYLYDKKGLDSVMIDLARSTFINVCTLYQIESGFINARQVISNNMLVSFQNAISYVGVPSDTQFAELRGYQYSNDYKDAITEKQNAQQQIDLLLSQRNVIVTNAQTNLSNYEQYAEIALQQADTTVQTIMTQASSQAEAIYTRWVEYADGFHQTMLMSGLDPDTFVETYLSIAFMDDPVNPNTMYVSVQ